MFDASYFKKQLDQHVAAGGGPLVELMLRNGHTYRMRSVLEVTEGFVVLEIYHMKGDILGHRPHWAGESKSAAAPGTTARAAVSYENIVAILVTPDEVQERNVGFSR